LQAKSAIQIKSGFIRIQFSACFRFLIGRIIPAHSIEESHEKAKSQLFGSFVFYP